MKLKFWKREKKEKKKAAVVEETESKPSALEKKCIEYGRPYLYEPLSRTLYLEPRGRDLDKLSAEKTPSSRSIIGNVMLYQTKDKDDVERLKLLEQTKEYFDAAFKLSKGSGSYSYLPKLMDEIDIVAKIAVDWWLEEGKYEELKKD